MYLSMVSVRKLVYLCVVRCSVRVPVVCCGRLVYLVALCAVRYKFGVSVGSGGRLGYMRCVVEDLCIYGVW